MDLELELLSRMIKTKHDENKKLACELKSYDYYYFLDKLNIEKTEYEELIKNLNLKGLIEATDKKIAAKPNAIMYVLTKKPLKQFCFRGFSVQQKAACKLQAALVCHLLKLTFDFRNDT